jgi:hypothetical protein
MLRALTVTLALTVVLEGSVVVQCERTNIKADRVLIRLADGSVEVGPAVPPTPPIVPVAQTCR